MSKTVQATLQNRDDSDFRVITSVRIEGGRPIVANIKVDGEIRRGQPAQVVMTVYGWSDSERVQWRDERRGNCVREG
ncbi:hypothetical protein [Thalassovita sp.]|uniref:hypothetical protein n=1 Tax=Thalassovita sp. TaxID=1979401 RepID=UPI0029DE790F|nr:hypothetical protein [Thalassovita sp.]